MNNEIQQNFEGGIIYPQKDWEAFLKVKGVTQECISYVLGQGCSDDFKVEEPEGVLRVCAHSNDKDYTKEGLRIIAQLRNETTLIVEDVCKNHRVLPGRHSFGDTLGGIFDELFKDEPEDNIIPFHKK